MLMHFLHSSIAPQAIVQSQHIPMFIVMRLMSAPADRAAALLMKWTMNMAYATNTYSTAAGGRISGLVATLAERLQRRRLYNATVRELSMLSAHELADLGLSRGAIHSAAYEAAYGK